MPHKDPEPKRQWEREHPEQRNERRRTARPVVSSELSSVEMPMPDPALDQGPQGIWIALVGLAVTIGVVLLAVFVGVSGLKADHFGTRRSDNLAKAILLDEGSNSDKVNEAQANSIPRLA